MVFMRLASDTIVCYESCCQTERDDEFMFCGCMIGGALYGTGRRFADLTADQRMTAMEVGSFEVFR